MPEYDAPCGDCRTRDDALATAQDQHATDARTIADLTTALEAARADALVQHEAASALREVWQQRHGSPLVYVASAFVGLEPHTDVYENLIQAEAAWLTLADHGIDALLPHAESLRVDPGHQRGEAFWRAHTMRLMKGCTRVLRLNNASEGADLEVEVAESLGIPVDRYITDTLKALGAMGE